MSGDARARAMGVGQGGHQGSSGGLKHSDMSPFSKDSKATQEQQSTGSDDPSQGDESTGKVGGDGIHTSTGVGASSAGGRTHADEKGRVG